MPSLPLCIILNNNGLMKSQTRRHLLSLLRPGDVCIIEFRLQIDDDVWVWWEGVRLRSAVLREFFNIDVAKRLALA